MNDKLTWWEKLPIVGLLASQGLYVWQWYTTLPAWTAVIALAGIAAVAAIDGAMVATVAGMRQGRRSKASYAAIIVTASFGAAVALDLYGAVMLVSAWLHAGFALTIVCYLLHLAAPRATSAQPLPDAAQTEQAVAQLEQSLAQAHAERAQIEQAYAQAHEGYAQRERGLAQLEQAIALRDDGLARAQTTIAQLEQSLAQAGDLDLREVAQWAASLGASKRDLARVLRRPESTVRAWVKTASAAD